jgi:hypothetical protein
LQVIAIKLHGASLDYNVAVCSLDAHRASSLATARNQTRNVGPLTASRGQVLDDIALQSRTSI